MQDSVITSDLGDTLAQSAGAATQQHKSYTWASFEDLSSNEVAVDCRILSPAISEVSSIPGLHLHVDGTNSH